MYKFCPRDKKDVQELRRRQPWKSLEETRQGYHAAIVFSKGVTEAQRPTPKQPRQQGFGRSCGCRNIVIKRGHEALHGRIISR